MLRHFGERRTNIAFEENGHCLASFGIHVCPRVRANVMFALARIERRNQFAETRRRRWVENDEHGSQTSSAGFAGKGKFLAKTALATRGNRDTQFEFVGELALAIVAINLASFTRRLAAFIQAFTGEFFEPMASPPRQLASTGSNK